MTVHITAANSSDVVSGNAFTGTAGVGAQDTLIVDANAFLIFGKRGGAEQFSRAHGTAIINGVVGSFGASSMALQSILTARRTLLTSRSAAPVTCLVTPVGSISTRAGRHN